MFATPVIAIFDVGKTNKKLFLFNEEYKIVHEETFCFPEIVDDDGDPCEDVNQLRSFVFSSLQNILYDKRYSIKAVNFSAYGASFVHMDANGEAVTPLYNYLKSYPPELLEKFYAMYGGKEHFSLTTASPVLGHLNSGLQLYWLKYIKPLLFETIKYSLHLPQYLSSLVTKNYFSELTSVGCHTNLWDFEKHQYHYWVINENILPKLAPIVASTHVVDTTLHNNQCSVGIGLHDSSAALIPYLASFHKPFVLISTGTWCISLNPFNQLPLTPEELQQDCLCYLTYEGKSVKASRLFAGHVHEQQVKRLAAHFHKAIDYYKTVKQNVTFILQHSLISIPHKKIVKSVSLIECAFAQRDLSTFQSFEEAYHQLMMDIVTQQITSTQLVLNGTDVKQIFVDGGFSKNPIYMHLLAMAFPELEIFAASMAQATAMGAALAIHTSWNTKLLPTDLIELKYHSAAQDA